MIVSISIDSRCNSTHISRKPRCRPVEGGMMEGEHRFHFIIKEDDEEVAALAGQLIGDVGQASLESADIIVSIGGDGKLLEAFALSSQNQKVFGLTPPGSNSHGFWPDHTISNGADLLDRIEKAGNFLIVPLRARIQFSQGDIAEAFGYNDIMIDKNDGQLPLFSLTGQFGKDSFKKDRVMGCYVLSTAYGSSSASMRYGGTITSIEQEAILSTGKGITSPEVFRATSFPLKGTSFHMDFISSDKKRPVSIECDGRKKVNDERKYDVVSMDVAEDRGKARQFLTMHNPGVRAFSASMPV